MLSGRNSCDIQIQPQNKIKTKKTNNNKKFEDRQIKPKQKLKY
jgi:hypothetical protein